MKLTSKDYVEARPSLEEVGFKAIRDMAKDGKTIEDIATLYGVPEKVVEVVITTGSYVDLKTIVELELDNTSLKTEIEQVHNTKPTPKRWHYVVAGVFLLAVAVGIVWGVVAIVLWARG